MVKSKNHQNRIPRTRRNDGRKKALKEKQPPANPKPKKRGDERK